MKRIIKYRHPKRVEPNTIFDPKKGLVPVGGWIVAKVLDGKYGYERPYYREVVVLDNGERLTI